MTNDPLMPFGKFKGKHISELTERYCQWLVKNVDLYGDVERAVKARLGIHVAEPESEDEKIDRAVRNTIELLRAAIDEADEVL